MKIIAIIVIVCFSLLVVGCGDSKTICIPESYTPNTGCHEFQQYGLFDANELKNRDIEYKVVWGNIFWSIVGFENVLLPVILLGWYMYEPVGVKPQGDIPGVK